MTRKSSLTAWADAEAFAEFEEIWFEDTEFIPPPGERPDVLCLCAYELRTGRRIELWDEQIGPTPPFRTDRRVLHVVFAATAECGCYLAKGWPLPGAAARPLSDVSLLHQWPQAAAGRQGSGRRLEPFRSQYGRQQVQRRDARSHHARPPIQPGGDCARNRVLLDRRRRDAGAAGVPAGADALLHHAGPPCCTGASLSRFLP